MSVVLTTARPGNAPALAVILGGWIAGCDWMPKLHTPDEDIAFVSGLIERQTVRVAWIGGKPAGFLSRDGGLVTCLYLASATRGQGIGARLLTEAKAAEPMLSLWTFQANTRAIGFYRREGFMEAERTDGAANDERLPDVRLVWRA
ncbi:MAG: GNAT family N-acetyltransferase [Paracoccaceae bacterium]